MKILAVDSTTEACSVALLDTERGSLPVEIFEFAAREHSQRLLPMVEQLLSDNKLTLNQIDAIAYGRGPGSFTGLRICAGLVQGLAFGADLLVVPVSSLAAMAQVAVDTAVVDNGQRIIASLDARMNEIYYGVYEQSNGVVVACGDEGLITPEQFSIALGDHDYVGVGNGWQYADRIPLASKLVKCDVNISPRAAAIARLALPLMAAGQTIIAEQAQPTYIRDQVAWKKISEQQQQ